jgi:hypothetical protein
VAADVYQEPRFLEALKRLGDFLLLAQMPEPQPAWAQQYSREMHPIWARRFEPPGVTGGESQDVLETLMKIYRQTGDKKYLEPIPRALAYLKKSLLPEGRLARYYELKTNRPLYMTRRGDEYSLTYDDSMLPDHYGWKVDSRLPAIESEYQSLIKTGNTTHERPTVEELRRDARQIIASLDSEGRWISTYSVERVPGQPRFKTGDRYISSAVFSRNMETLSALISTVR